MTDQVIVSSPPEKVLGKSNIPLPVKLRKNGFDYEQILRGRKTCIYRQYVTPEIEYFEVFRRKVRPARIIQNKFIPAREAFPRNEDFGMTAWTFRKFEDAINKFKEEENEKNCA